MSSPASGHDTDTPGSSLTGKRKFFHTTEAQRECLLEWLELPGNFDLLTKPKSGDAVGGSSTSSPPPKRPKKADGYRSLAQYMNRVALTQWTEKTARSRFESFLGVYRKLKRQGELSTIYHRVDALFGPDGDTGREERFRSGSLGQKSEGSRSPLPKEHQVFHELSVATPDATRNLLSDEQEATSPPRRRARPNRSFETVDAAVETSSPLPGSDQALRVESQRLAVRQQELELKQTELRARQEENRQKLRAEVLTKLVEAGKSPAEVREYLAIIDPVDNPPRR
ncbi:hypothetical protein PRIC1_005363 [Phytophthora ramorum]|uniref:uncharacterized protein n=1 Tax=Phytophthora ramorum TaxID=164328 RepID=UPI00309FBCC9|nr:hypothetical protein KRP23_9180 [Phytophthora ramorum]